MTLPHEFLALEGELYTKVASELERRGRLDRAEEIRARGGALLRGAELLENARYYRALELLGAAVERVMPPTSKFALGEISGAFVGDALPMKKMGPCPRCLQFGVPMECPLCANTRVIPLDERAFYQALVSILEGLR